MRIAYFDCFAGISGDMSLGAWVDAGMPVEYLVGELKKLNLPNWEISAKKVKKRGLSGTKISVEVQEEKKHRHLPEIIEIINQSTLSKSVKELSLDIFHSLAKAEAKVHGVDLGQVHFHEVGALDSILDIIGFAIGFDYFRIEKVYASPIHVGRGTIQCAHGLLPVPAPATAELLQGIPIYSTQVEGELVTPTGAAILSTVCQDYGEMPEMKVESVGYGAGTKDFSIANLLRVMIGETKEISGLIDRIVQLETNIDDLNPQIYQHLMDKLLDQGALDVYLQPIQMKKSRPGTVLNVLAKPEQVNDLTQTIFRETTTLGVRILPLERRILEREVMEVETPYGLVGVKMGKMEGELTNLSPEYEHCREIALRENIPLKNVLEKARQAAWQKVR